LARRVGIVDLLDIVQIKAEWKKHKVPSVPTATEFEELQTQLVETKKELANTKKRLVEVETESANKRTSSSGRKSKAAVYVREQGLCAVTALPLWNPECYYFGRDLPRDLKESILDNLKARGFDIGNGKIKEGDLPLKHTSINSHVVEHEKLLKHGSDVKEILALGIGANSLGASILLCAPVDRVFNYHRLTVQPATMLIEVVCPQLRLTTAAAKLDGTKIAERNPDFPPKQVWEFHYKLSNPHKCTKECKSLAKNFEQEMA